MYPELWPLFKKNNNKKTSTVFHRHNLLFKIFLLQGREILKNFTSIIKRNMDVMKITVKVDWWKIRRELDSDMEV